MTNTIMCLRSKCTICDMLALWRSHKLTQEGKTVLSRKAFMRSGSGITINEQSVKTQSVVRQKCC